MKLSQKSSTSRQQACHLDSSTEHGDNRTKESETFERPSNREIRGMPELGMNMDTVGRGGRHVTGGTLQSTYVPSVFSTSRSELYPSQTKTS